VLVWKIDRFGRSLKHLVNALAELAALGVASQKPVSGQLPDKLA
jgi:DNA invertase Pin-like site-specific DNA recombinase